MTWVALPPVIDVQRRLFGEDGSVGGGLLAALLRLDREPYGLSQDFEEAAVGPSGNCGPLRIGE